jgi:preprotein translocase subunit SecA
VSSHDPASPSPLSTRPIPEGLDAFWHAGLGVVDRVHLRSTRYALRAGRVLATEKTFQEMTDAQLRQEAESLRETFRRGRDTRRDIERGLAVIREVADRQLGMRPYHVQVMGGLAIAEGSIVEMATGEGKTLTATFPATLGGWRGRGCHVLTTNDYLACRDAEAMQKVYRFCGLQVASIEQSMKSPERRAAYKADITYTTNKEVTADFLRDRLILGRIRGKATTLIDQIMGGRSAADSIVQRGLYCAVVDEADSVLVDEAVTPLIISGSDPHGEQVEAFGTAAELVDQLSPHLHYRVNPRQREVELTDPGRVLLADLAESLGGIWKVSRCREELAVKALLAKELYSRDKQYVIDAGKIVIVDDFTGRLMPDRTWRDGLHQAVEAKEHLEVTPPKDTYARVSFQRFFRLYTRLSGMTGTAREAAGEFWQIYNLPIVVVPPNRPCIRRQLPDVVLATERAKWARIASEIRTLHETGRPILVGTRSVQASEHLSQMLATRRLRCQVLNAVRHKEEAQIVAGAGQPGQITISTNMAGRGTDIKLGRGVAELGGLHVIAAERNESSRIDRQLYGRCGRQGDPGSSQAIVSLEDELIVRYAGHVGGMLRARHSRSMENIASPVTRSLFRLAQRKAQRIAFRLRKGVTRTDRWLDEYLSFADKA